MTIDEALTILSLASHRGARSWRYDEGCRRVLPEGWNGLDEAAPPSFTAWRGDAGAAANRDWGL